MNKNLIALILVSVLLVSCTSTGQVVKEQESMRIGVVLPLTGSGSYLGDYMEEGLELAKDEINGAGGVNGRRVELVYEDSMGETKNSITAYQKLTDINDVKIVFATLSHVTLGIAPFAEEDQVILMSVGGAAPKISEAGDYVFRHNLLPQEETKFIADFMYNELNIREVGLIGVNTESGVSWTESFVKAFEDAGGEIRLSEFYARDVKDFRTFLLKAKQADLENIVGVIYPDQLGFVVKQSSEYDYDFNWFATYSAATPKFLEVAGDSGNGIIYSHFLNTEYPLYKGYNEKYKARYHKSSDAFAALAYDALGIIASAIEQCPSEQDTECIKQRLYATQDYQGATGKISFDENGDTRKELFIKTIRNGEFVLY